MIEMAYATTNGTAAANPWMGMIPWIAIFAIMYFMMIRPQQKREKQRQEMINQLKKGDRVLLMSGFYGKVIKPGENIFTIELGKGLQVEVERNAIAALANPTTETTASEDKAE